MNDVTRLMSVAVVAVGLAMPGVAVNAEEPDGEAPVVAAQGLWDSLSAGTYGVLEYGVQTVHAVTGWLTGAGPAPDEIRGEDIRGLLSLSDKEFRDFDALVHAAGYVLQGYSFGLAGGSEVELAFDFERALADRERNDLRHQLEQQSGTSGSVRRSIVQGLLDASRYVDASPASGYRLAGVWMRLGTPPEVRVRFRRSKP